MKKIILLGLLLWCSLNQALSQNTTAINPVLFAKEWPARWISHPTANLTDFGIYHFRRTVDLPAKPERFIVHVSGDNRYQLLVNGKAVSEGPARGDVTHWNYETVDLAPYLQAGKNTLAAVVWNFSKHMPLAQMTHKTGFILQGNGDAEAIVNTDEKWKIWKNEAYSPIPYGPVAFWAYYVVGPGEIVDGAKYPWGWEQTNFNDSQWLKPIVMERGRPQETEGHAYWMLTPRTIPAMEHKLQRFGQVRRTNGIQVSDKFLKGTASLTVPANTKVTILLDQNVLTTAYPYLITSGGKGSEVMFTYGETLFTDKKKKPNRNQVEEGLEIWGNSDKFISDGGQKRQFKPLWWRTFRYVQLDIQTKDEPLVINDLYSDFTAYPFQEKAKFTSDNNSLKDIWNVGWRTARLCANETYMDCPFYEQLQYIGDTRIQSLISLYVSGDDRLMRQALTSVDNSRVTSGLTQSRFPSDLPQFIPNFSLIWIAMVNDYWMHRQDDAFVKQFLPGITGVLSWYERKLNQDQMIENLPFWEVIDHPYQAKQILVPGSKSKSMTGSSLIYALALDKASELFRHFGKSCEADEYQAKAKALKETIYRLTYDQSKQMLADTPDKLSFSQHANILGILIDVIPQNQQAALIEKVANDKNIIQASTYFQFYLFRAMKKSGRGDMFIPALQPWRNMLADGLTTFAEWEVQPRSDCHAWSAGPVYEMLATVCGVEPASAGFKTVRIAPALGALQKAEGSLPHPAGDIKIKLKRQGTNGIEADILLPAGVTGEFAWNGKNVALKGGNQKVKL